MPARENLPGPRALTSDQVSRFQSFKVNLRKSQHLEVRTFNPYIPKVTLDVNNDKR